MLFLIFSSLLLAFILIIRFSRIIGYKGLRINIIKLYSLIFFISLINAYQVLLLESSFDLIQWEWVNIAEKSVFFGIFNDSLSCCMLIAVITVSGIVNIYSLSYMGNDPHLGRFMAYLTLFTLLMVILVSSSNLAVLFIG